MQWEYVSGPLSGAVIGYVTNWIAIKMLFRPLNEKRVFGIKIPFTPGVIPRERQRIAVSIGNVVSSYLLTEQQITRTLLERKTEVGLTRFIRQRLFQIIKSNLTVREAIVSINGIDNDFLDQLSLKLSTYLSTIVSAQDTQDTIIKHLQNQINGYLASTIEESIHDQQLNDLSQSIEAALNHFFSNQKLKENLEGFIDYKLKNLLENHEAIGTYIPSTVIIEVEKFFSLQSPEIILLLKKYLHSPEVKTIISQRLEGFFESHLGNKFLGLLANAVKKRSDKITEKISDAINNFLLDEKLQQDLVRFLQEFLRSMLNTKISVLAQKLQLDQTDKRLEWVNWIYTQLTERNKIESLISYIKTYIKDHKNCTWYELFERHELKKELIEEHTNRFLSKLVQSIFTRPEFKEAVINTAKNKINLIYDRNICELTANIQNKHIIQLADLLVFNSQLLIPKYIPQFLKTIDIKSITQKSVENLDVSQIENVLLGVTRNELSYITWFGALLGLLIGILNSVII
ncbi:DUF445 family protein [Desulfolucanica intricata]|uniref:DUF445 family protein n=1 Tax=Desulfolucanica intricata TaxID=1285191 RepID=UPI00083460F2|nr:DUF445 family protein [Desulfolucanica intricata]